MFLFFWRTLEGEVIQLSEKQPKLPEGEKTPLFSVPLRKKRMRLTHRVVH